MALTLRSNGNNPINIVTAQWFNDFYNLFTGVMTDQPVEFNYRPAATTSTPALELATNGNAPLLLGLTSSGGTAFKFDASGNLTLPAASVNATSGLFDNGNRVAIQGAHSAGQPIVSYGTGQPASLGANEVFFQLA